MSIAVELDPGVIAYFCRKWRVRELSLFGSALRNDFGSDSDLDFLVSFEPDSHWDLLNLVEMKSELEEHFGRPVDLIEKDAIRNPWRRHEILSTRQVIHAS